VHARAFERREVCDCRPAITCAARDHHGARARAFAIRQSEHEAAVPCKGRGIEPDHLVRDRHLDPELLRLGVGARHQRHAADARGESKVVFDPRRGASLPAERAAVEH